MEDIFWLKYAFQKTKYTFKRDEIENGTGNNKRETSNMKLNMENRKVLNGKA